MNYQEIIEGLQPLLSDKFLPDELLQDTYLTKCLGVLNDLAIHLRTNTNRDLIRETGLFLQLLDTLQYLLEYSFTQFVNRDACLQLVSELLRCLANSLIDNDKNREVFWNKDFNKKNGLLNEYISKILKIDQEVTSSFDLQIRTIVVLKNLCLGNDEYISILSKLLSNHLIKFLEKTYKIYLNISKVELLVLCVELVSDFIEFWYNDINLSDLKLFAEILQMVSINFNFSDLEYELSKDNSEYENPYYDILLALSQILEISLTKNETLNFSNSESTIKLQEYLLDSLDKLHEKHIDNIIISRRIMTSIGHISSNLTNTNIQSRNLCYDYIINSRSPYSLASVLIILSNSISSRDDVNIILSQISLSQIIDSISILKDPIQFQGFLDLFKKMLNIENFNQLDFPYLLKLSNLIQISQDQSKYYTYLSPLIEGLLNKLLLLLSGDKILKLIQESTFGNIINNSGSITACLALDKLSLKKNNVEPNIILQLWNSVFRFKDSMVNNNEISIPFLFQLTKSLGIFLRCSTSNEPNVVLKEYSKELNTLLQKISELKNKKDSASKSILNNGKFVAAMVINLVNDDQCIPEDQKLIETSRKLLDE